MRQLKSDFRLNQRLLSYSLGLLSFILLIAFGLYCFNGSYQADWRPYQSVKTYALDVAKIIGLITVIIGVYNLGLSRKKFNFDVIESCVSRFKEIFDGLQSAEAAKDQERINFYLDKYLHLVNEELFYIANEYVPQEVGKEWIDGMIDFLPLINQQNMPVNHKEIEYPKEMMRLLQEHPRVWSSFQYNGSIDSVYSKKLTERIKSRKRLVLRIIRQLRKFEY